MLVPILIGAALLLKDSLTPPPAAPVAVPAPAPVPPQVQYYLTSQSVLKANDMMATQGMSPDQASQQAASDVVDEYFATKG
jgi:hypothetical protein